MRRGRTIRFTPHAAACRSRHARARGDRARRPAPPRSHGCGVRPLDRAVEAADQRVAAKQRADVPAEAAQVRRTIDLPAIVEAERHADEGAIPDERIERAEEANPAIGGGMPALRETARREVGARRAHHLHLLDSALGEERLPGPPHVGRDRASTRSRLRRARGGRPPRRARGAPSAGTPRRALLGGPLWRVDAPPRRVRQRALGHVIELAARPAPADHDLAAGLQHLERHLRARGVPRQPLQSSGSTRLWSARSSAATGPRSRTSSSTFSTTPAGSRRSRSACDHHGASIASSARYHANASAGRRQRSFAKCSKAWPGRCR